MPIRAVSSAAQEVVEEGARRVIRARLRRRRRRDGGRGLGPGLPGGRRGPRLAGQERAGQVDLLGGGAPGALRRLGALVAPALGRGQQRRRVEPAEHPVLAGQERAAAARDLALDRRRRRRELRGGAGAGGRAVLEGRLAAVLRDRAVRRAGVDDEHRAQVVAQRVEAVDRRRLEEEEVHQPLDAPVDWKLLSSFDRFFVSGLAFVANEPRSLTIGLAASSALRPGTDASPRLTSAGVAAWLNGPSCSMKRLISGALGPSASITGVIWSD